MCRLAQAHGADVALRWHNHNDTHAAADGFEQFAEHAADGNKVSHRDDDLTLGRPQ